MPRFRVKGRALVRFDMYVLARDSEEAEGVAERRVEDAIGKGEGVELADVAIDEVEAKP